MARHRSASATASATAATTARAALAAAARAREHRVLARHGRPAARASLDSRGRTHRLDGRPPAPFHQGVSRIKPEHREWLTAECDRCLLTGAFARATCFDYVSKAFVVEHNGKKRLVFNLKHLNDYCVKRACRFGSLAALRRTLHQGDLMWSVDLSDAYHHVGIYQGHQKYFTFAVETSRGIEYFSTAALNFGWCRSPQIFTEFMKPIVAYLRNPSADAPAARVLPWLDDFMFSFSGSLSEAISVRDHSFDTLTRCGVTRNVTKGQPDPSTLLYDHLGYGIDSAAMRFLLTDKRERKLRLRTSALLRSAARARRLVRKRELVSLLGLASRATWPYHSSASGCAQPGTTRPRSLAGPAAYGSRARLVRTSPT